MYDKILVGYFMVLRFALVFKVLYEKNYRYIISYNTISYNVCR